jgi:peptidoglycan/xylan/chitin deacetylase (PgdA/CDA1 family)
MLLNPLPWPDGHRCAVSITWDVDVDSGLRYAHGAKADALMATQSFVKYSPRVALPRLMQVFATLELRLTFFVPGWVIDTFPSAVEQIRRHGHEIGLHGYLHERSHQLAKTDEAEVVERALRAYENLLGGRPRGWRAPGFAFSDNSLELLLAAGFDYDSSLMGNDLPYVIEGASGQLLELPTDWTLDDWPYYMHNRDFNYTMPICAPARAMEVFRAEFDAAHRYGALWISVWHPFLSGRPARLHAIVELVEYMRSKRGVWFAPLEEICDHVEKLRLSGMWHPMVEKIPRAPA